MRESRVGSKAESKTTKNARAMRISATLEKLYLEGRISLDFTTPWECLAATILSAQCTDARVNRVTPELFRAIPDVGAMAAAPLDKIEKLIVTTGFFRSKARSLKTCAAMIVNDFEGKLPETMEELVRLPGVHPQLDRVRQIPSELRAPCEDHRGPGFSEETLEHVGLP